MSYSIKPMDPKIDRVALQNIWKKNLRRVFDNRFAWLYEEQPFNETKTWVAIDDSTEIIVGSGTLYPRTVYFFGKEFEIGIAADFAINRDHRVFGPALKLQQALCNGGSDSYQFIFAHPNKSSQGIFKRAGYQQVGTATHWVKLLHTEKKLRQYVKIAMFSKIISFFVDSILNCADYLNRLLIFKKCAIEIKEHCDDSFDELWENAKGAYSIIGKKDSGYLNWRYNDFRGESYKFFCVYDNQHSNLIGFTVFTIIDGVAEICDLFALDQKKSINLLLLEFSKAMRKQRIDTISVSYFGHRFFTRALKKLFFHKRPLERSCMVFISNNLDQNNSSEILQQSNWFLFEGEMDL